MDEHRMRDGFRLALKGGPLAGGVVRVRDTEVRLAVVQESGRLHMRDSEQIPVLRRSDARLIGAYGFSHREEAMVWFPAR